MLSLVRDSCVEGSIAEILEALKWRVGTTDGVMEGGVLLGSRNDGRHWSNRKEE